MRHLLLALGLAFAGTAWAHNCPNEMKDIDAKLKTKPALSSDDAAKVAKLRAELKREPTEDEVAGHMQMSPSEYDKAMDQVRTLDVGAIRQLDATGEDGFDNRCVSGGCIGGGGEEHHVDAGGDGRDGGLARTPAIRDSAHAERVENVMADRVNGLGAKALDAACRVVAVQGRQVDAGQSLEEPGGLRVLLHRAAAGQGGHAALACRKVDALVHHPAEVELHARIARPAMIGGMRRCVDRRLVHFSLPAPAREDERSPSNSAFDAGRSTFETTVEHL